MFAPAGGFSKPLCALCQSRMQQGLRALGVGGGDGGWGWGVKPLSVRWRASARFQHAARLRLCG